jgi:hypothetical protein
MSGYVPLHIEYLEGVVADSGASPSRRELAQQISMFGSPPPCYVLPRPPTYPELIAAVMMAEAHLKAGEFGMHLGEHLATVLYWAREPEARAMRIADVGDRVAEIAEAMVQAGRATAQRLGCAGDAATALHKLESMPCPTCGRPFHPEPDNLPEE